MRSLRALQLSGAFALLAMTPVSAVAQGGPPPATAEVREVAQASGGAAERAAGTSPATPASDDGRQGVSPVLVIGLALLAFFSFAGTAVLLRNPRRKTER